MPHTYKLIEPWQGKYILQNHGKMTPKEMAEKIPLDEIKVRIFCQSEGLTMISSRKTARRRRYK